METERTAFSEVRKRNQSVFRLSETDKFNGLNDLPPDFAGFGLPEETIMNESEGIVVKKLKKFAENHKDT
ncbi:MAG: hypothetical protein JJU05_06995 [Verrucomicrobia bacterium]|nr:hypothetical protein [Verrucomicrobiota bacterium]MCH8526043.1 hypothetical protein [Kiritimatiellia bacterium]